MRMPVVVLLACMFAASAPVACEKSKVPDKQVAVRPLEERDLALAGVRLGMTRQQVQAALGKPGKTEKSTVRNDAIEQDVDVEGWEYPTLYVEFLWDNVGSIATSDPRYTTARGLAVGDSVQRAQDLYGTFLDLNDKPIVPAASGSYDYQSMDLFAAVLLFWDSGKIERIELAKIID